MPADIQPYLLLNMTSTSTYMSPDRSRLPASPVATWPPGEISVFHQADVEVSSPSCITCRPTVSRLVSPSRRKQQHRKECL